MPTTPNVTPVYVITHIDILPSNMEAGRELLLRFAWISVTPLDSQDSNYCASSTGQTASRPWLFGSPRLIMSTASGRKSPFHIGSACTRSSAHRSMIKSTFSNMNCPIVAGPCSYGMSVTDVAGLSEFPGRSSPCSTVSLRLGDTAPYVPWPYGGGPRARPARSRGAARCCTAPMRRLHRWRVSSRGDPPPDDGQTMRRRAVCVVTPGR